MLNSLFAFCSVRGPDAAFEKWRQEFEGDHKENEGWDNWNHVCVTTLLILLMESVFFVKCENQWLSLVHRSARHQERLEFQNRLAEEERKSKIDDSWLWRVLSSLLLNGFFFKQTRHFRSKLRNLKSLSQREFLKVEENKRLQNLLKLLLEAWGNVEGWQRMIW